MSIMTNFRFAAGAAIFLIAVAGCGSTAPTPPLPAVAAPNSFATPVPGFAFAVCRAALDFSGPYVGSDSSANEVVHSGTNIVAHGLIGSQEDTLTFSQTTASLGFSGGATAFSSQAVSGVVFTGHTVTFSHVRMENPSGAAPESVSGTLTCPAVALASSSPSMPTSTRAAMTVTPSTGGTGTPIQVVVKGAPANASGEVILCGASAGGTPLTTPDTVCDAGGGIAEQADARGALDVTYTIATHLTPSPTYAIFFLDTNSHVVAQAPFTYNPG